jgi:ABC-type transport system involved in multi-copper enzyme maturation permease subunit
MMLANLPGEWLTSFWLLAIGAGLGLVLLAVSLIVFMAGGRLGLGKLADASPASFTVFGGIMSLLFLGTGLYVWQWFTGQSQEVNWILAFLLLVPGCAFLGFGTVAMFKARSQEQMLEWLREGVGLWMLVIASTLAIFAVFGIAGQQIAMIRFVGRPIAMLESVRRLPLTGVQPDIKVKILPASIEDSGSPVKVDFVGAELKRIGFGSSQRIEFSPTPIFPESDREKILELPGSSEPVYFSALDVAEKLPKDYIEFLYVRNLSDRELDLTIYLETQPEFPQVTGIFVTALVTWGAFLVVLFQSALLPKEAAISWSTFKTETSQPLFGILVGVGIIFLVIALYIPYNTFGEDIKMYITTGRPVILLLSIFFAVWAASKSVAEEIDGRTALTVLAKPLSRRQFLVGKTLGIGWAVGMLFLLIGLTFLFLVSYKTIYDGVESSKGALPWQDGYAEMAKVAPALILGYMETMIFVFVSVMISTRLAIVSNLMICFSIYILGHITPMLLEKEDTFESVTVVGQAVTTIIPVLEHFDISAAIVGEATVPAAYLGWALVYTSLYSAVALLVALILFEDRDLS